VKGNNMSIFSKGNVVQLKMGSGPEMVVEKIGFFNGKVICVWYCYHQKKMLKKSFEQECLRIYEFLDVEI